MKLSYLLAIFSIVLLISCATSKQIYTPDGKLGYSIDCDGTALSWGHCFEKAGEICGAKGYDVINKSGDQGAMVGGSSSGFYGGSLMKRNMVISCKP